MAKDILRTIEAERQRADQRRERPAELDIVSEGYKRTVPQPELRRVERDRKALRERLFAAG